MQRLGRARSWQDDLDSSGKTMMLSKRIGFRTDKYEEDRTRDR